MSALIGGLICLVPSVYSAYKLTAKRTADLGRINPNNFLCRAWQNCNNRYTIHLGFCYSKMDSTSSII